MKLFVRPEVLAIQVSEWERDVSETKEGNVPGDTFPFETGNVPLL